MSFEVAHDLESLREDANDAIGAAKEEVFGAGADAADLVLSTTSVVRGSEGRIMRTSKTEELSSSDDSLTSETSKKLKVFH